MHNGVRLRVAYDSTVSARAATGVSVYAHELLAALRSRPLEVIEWRRHLGPRGSTLGRIVNGARLAAWYGVEIDRRVARESVSVYHSTTALGPLKVNRPVVVSVHDQTAVTMPVRRGFADRRFMQVFSVQAARRADAILSPTTIAADAISAAYGVPRDRIRVVPLGVASAFRSVAAAAVEDARVRRSLHSPYVLFVGAEPPRKNLARLVQAFAAVATGHKEVQLVFVGPGEPRDPTLTALVDRLGLSKRFRRLGAVTREELPAIYAGAACLAMVSLVEGFGLTVAEGMAAGTPVVASNCSSMPEVAGGAALLVDPLSVDDIAGGLDRVLCDSALAEGLRRRGRVRSEAFRWKHTAAMTEDVYRAVAGR